MSNDSPVSVLYGSNGIEVAVDNNVAIPANTKSLPIAGSDGTAARIVKTDNSGRVVTKRDDLTFTATVNSSNIGVPLTINVQGKNTVCFSLVNSSYVGNFQIEGQNGDSNFQVLTAYTPSGTSATSFTTPSPSFFYVNCAGLKEVIINQISWTAGSFDVSAVLTDSAPDFPDRFKSPIRDFSNTALAADAVYVTPVFDTLTAGQSYLSVAVWSVTNIAYYFEESNDNTNYYIVGQGVAVNQPATIGGATFQYGVSDTWKITSRYARVRYANGKVANAGGSTNLYLLTSLESTGIQKEISLVDRFGTHIDVDPVYGLNVNPPEDTDAFGALIAHARISQVSANFSQPLANNDVTTTTVAGGSATVSQGSLVISTAAASGSSSATAQSNTVLSYSPGREAYAMFTAAFTAGLANVTQQIGIYDASNGFFIGFNGTTFGVTRRSNGTDTTTAQSAFNEDTLVGNVNSDFTRGGVPEAINFTTKNVFRIRFGWLGAAPIRFEVLSPDGRWVRFHTIRYPNTAVPPSIANVSLPVRMEVVKSAATGGTYSISSSSWDAGVVDFGNADLDYLGTITAAGGTFTSTTKGKGTISFNLTGTWAATLVIEGHNGDNNWSSLTGYTAAGTPVTSISSNQFFYVNCAAYSQVRLRAPVFVSGTVNIATAATTNLVSIFTQTEGNSAAAAADTGNPLKIGGVGRTALPTAVTDGQRTNLYTDKLGRVVVTNAQARDLLVTNVATITNSTAQASIGGAAGAGISTDVSTITLANVGATGTEARLRSGDGNVRALYFIPANQTITVNYPVPLTNGNASVNSNWTVQLSVGTITVYVSVLFVQNV